MDKAKLPVNYPLATEKQWAAYFWSLLQKAVQLHAEQCTYFVDPRKQQIARELLHHFTTVNCSFYGGYPQAERVRLCVRPCNLANGGESTRISCLALSGDFPEGVLTHRDFLGALLGLGIKRDMVGDIIYRGGKTAWVFLVKEMANYVKGNLHKAGRFSLEAEEVEPGSLTLPPEPRRVKEIKGTVASMRLDAVAGLGFGLSRSKVLPLIRGERVKVNHQFISQPSRKVKEGDIISLMGRGRIEIVKNMGESRKGRIHLLLFRIF